MKPATDKTSWHLILLSVLLALIAGFLLPLITDEAYYLDWSIRSGWPRLGFFDHPPMVSWIAAPYSVFRDIFAARFTVWIMHLISIYYVYKTARLLTPSKALAATLLIASTVGALANGFLLTPDVGIMTFWIIAIHESVIAVRGHPKRWLTAGLATGLGLWSKYTMVLIGPVFLWGLIRDARKQLLTPWPYFGGAICALVIAPHLWWQSQNNWVTFRFQFGHGFSITQSISSGSRLPIARDPDVNDLSARKLQNELFAAMNKVAGFSEAFEKPKPDKTKWEKAIQYTGDFLGGVVGLWGIYALTAIFYLATGKAKIKDKKKHESTQGMAIIRAGAFFPLIFFGLLLSLIHI